METSTLEAANKKTSINEYELSAPHRDDVNAGALNNDAQNSDNNISENNSSNNDSEEEQLFGLVDPNKPGPNEDIALESELMIARNLRRLEIHRYEIATALANISEEEIGDFCEDEEEIEITESDEKYAKHINRITNNALARRKDRLSTNQTLEKTIAALGANLGKAKTKISLKSWDFMRQNLFQSWHQNKFDQEMEQRLFHPLTKLSATNHPQAINEGEINLQGNSSAPSPCPPPSTQPCAPVRLINWSLDCLAAYQEGGSFRHFIFIDTQAGHGRTILQASHHDFRAIYGMEPREKWAQDAIINIAQYPRTFMKQRQVELFTSDFRQMEWPLAPLVINIYNPQSADWLDQLMENLTQSYNQVPRQVYIMIINNKHKDVLSKYTSFQSFTPPSSNIEQISLMSPYEINFYSSVSI